MAEGNLTRGRETVLHQYDVYHERMMISNDDGVERPVARIRELIPKTFVQALEEDYTSETQDLSKDYALQRALHLFACEDDESLDPA